MSSCLCPRKLWCILVTNTPSAILRLRRTFNTYVMTLFVAYPQSGTVYGRFPFNSSDRVSNNIGVSVSLLPQVRRAAKRGGTDAQGVGV